MLNINLLLRNIFWTIAISETSNNYGYNNPFNPTPVLNSNPDTKPYPLNTILNLTPILTLTLKIGSGAGGYFIQLLIPPTINIETL